MSSRFPPMGDRVGFAPDPSAVLRITEVRSGAWMLESDEPRAGSAVRRKPGHRLESGSWTATQRAVFPFPRIGILDEEVEGVGTDRRHGVGQRPSRHPALRPRRGQAAGHRQLGQCRQPGPPGHPPWRAGSAGRCRSPRRPGRVGVAGQAADDDAVRGRVIGRRRGRGACDVGRSGGRAADRASRRRASVVTMPTPGAPRKTAGAAVGGARRGRRRSRSQETPMTPRVAGRVGRRCEEPSLPAAATRTTPCAQA